MNTELKQLIEDAAQASPLDLMECLQDRPVEPSKAVQGKCVVQTEKQEPVAWVGCGECDCEFPCYHGKTTCLRLPTDKQEPLCYLIEQWMHYEQAEENSPAAFPVFTRPQDLTAEVERLREELKIYHDADAKAAAQIHQQAQCIAELEEAAREAREALRTHQSLEVYTKDSRVREAIAKLDGVLGNVEMTTVFAGEKK